MDQPGRDEGGFAKGVVGVALTRNNHAEATFHALKHGGHRFDGFRRRRREMVAELPDYPRWVVVRVTGGREFAVADDLTACGFYGYAPHRVVVCRRARIGGPLEKRAAVERDYAVFAGHVFVGCPQGRYVGRRTHEAILAVLGDALGRPGLTQAAVADLNRLHAAGALQKREAPALKRGDPVDVEIAGVSVRGVVRALIAAGVEVEAEMFGQAVTVDAGLDKVRRVAP